MRFKFLLIYSLILCCTAVSEPIIETDITPEIIFNCNIVEGEDSVTVYLDLQITSSSNKLFNASIKGQGLAKDYYKNVEDIKSNSVFNSESVLTLNKNGTYFVF